MASSARIRTVIRDWVAASGGVLARLLPAAAPTRDGVPHMLRDPSASAVVVSCELPLTAPAVVALVEREAGRLQAEVSPNRVVLTCTRTGPDSFAVALDGQHEGRCEPMFEGTIRADGIDAGRTRLVISGRAVRNASAAVELDLAYVEGRLRRILELLVRRAEPRLTSRA
ncbi:MAG TPA: hypothetical protein VMD91_15920 [Candidatus Sulfotelmatobacter sp.]|nr:hypothetical protein [Candidatus Sulfotelmatobacter sp.]